MQAHRCCKKGDNLSFRITVIHAFVAVDEDDEEGLVGFRQQDGTWMPLVCADETRLKQVERLAHYVAQLTGKKVRHVRFSIRDDLEEFTE